MPIFRDVGDGFASRWLSSLIALVEIAGAFITEGASTGITMILICALAWCCIWFPNVVGEQTERFGRNSRETPPRLVWIAGWGLLLIPILVVIAWWKQGVFAD